MHASPFLQGQVQTGEGGEGHIGAPLVPACFLKAAFGGVIWVIGTRPKPPCASCEQRSTGAGRAAAVASMGLPVVDWSITCLPPA